MSRHPSTRVGSAALLALLCAGAAGLQPVRAQDIMRGSGPGISLAPPRNSRPPVRRSTGPRTGPRQPAGTPNPAIIPAKAVALYEHGNQFYDRNQIDEAIAEYEAAIKMHSKYPDAWLMLGNAFYDRARLDDAVEAWQRALALDNTLYQAHYNIANASYARKDFEKAVDGYRAVLKVQPDHADAQFGLANSLLQLKRYEEAVTHLERSIAAKGGRYPEARLSLAYAHFRLNDLTKAEAAARKAIEEMGADTEESAVSWNALGLILYQKSDYAGAAEAFGRLIEICKGCPSEVLSQVYYNQSLVLEAMGKRAEAANALDEYLRLAPYVTNKQDLQNRLQRLRQKL